MQEKAKWAEYIKKSFENLQNNQTVINSAKKRTDLNKAQYSKIIAYIERLEALFIKYNDKESFRIKMFDLIVKAVVIREENIEEDYYYHEFKIAHDQGRNIGVTSITEDYKKSLATQVIENQKTSLKLWFDYLCDASNTDNAYPSWFRFYAFAGATTLGQFDKEKEKFRKRDNSTIAIFANLDREALALIYDTLIQYFNNPNAIDEEFKEIASIAKLHDFNRLYSDAIKILNKQKRKNTTDETIGIWKKYNKDSTGSEAQRLVDDISSYATGWCTAGISTAKSQLEQGDFYVYYVHDEQGVPKIPKIAIRLIGNDEIAEIRGTDANQNLENDVLASIAEEKAKEFKGYEKYQKATYDMKRLTNIYGKKYIYDKKTHAYIKRENSEDLSIEDLRFLYEIDNKIQGFGYQKDERIDQLLSNRNIKKDLSSILNLKEDEISLTKEEALSGKSKYHYGNLDLSNLTTLESGCLPNYVGGNLYLNSLTTLEPGSLPNHVGGYLNLSSLTTLELGCLPNQVEGDLYLWSLTTLEPGCLPNQVEGDLYLWSLTTLELGCLPNQVGGDLDLSSLTTLKPGFFPKGFKCKNVICADIGLQKQFIAKLEESEEYWIGLEKNALLNSDLENAGASETMHKR